MRLRGGAGRQVEAELRALAGRAVGADGSAVALHDALRRGQSDAHPRKFGVPVQAVKRLEKIVRIGHVKAGAVVAHDDEALVVDHLRMQPDIGKWRVRRGA